MTTKIFLIRHGESQQNIDDVLSGITDTPLSENGKQECETLSHYFEKILIDHVFASPLQRAKQSAEIIFPEHKSSVQIAESLVEFNYGTYEGYQRAMYDSEQDDIIRQWVTAPSNLTFPKGGNIQEHAQKSYAGFMELVSQNEDSTIACLSHRTTIRLIIAKIIGLPLDNFRSLPCSNCGVTQITFNGEWQLNFLNLTPKFLNE